MICKKETKRTGFVQAGKKKIKEDLLVFFNYLMGGYIEDRARLLSKMHRDNTKGSDQKLQQKGQSRSIAGAQRGCGVTHLGAIQHFIRHSCEQPQVMWPCFDEGAGPRGLLRILST